jgi:predicted ATPase/class 3 adenylate cyclase
MTDLPAGTVTLLFSDVEGSTRLLARSGHRYAEIQDGHRGAQRAAWARWGGHELSTEGDSFFVVFAHARNAVLAAIDVQRELAERRFAGAERVRVRIGVHTGEPMRHGDDLIGMDVHRGARIASAAHGGQVVVSAVTRDLVYADLGLEVHITDLGRHRLKDLPEPERLFQVDGPGETASFPPLRSLGAVSRLPVPPTALVGREAALEELRELLGRPDVRLVTLLGPGGSGKSRLAVALVPLLHAFVDGTFFVSLANETTREGMWTSIANTLGVGGDVWDPSELLQTIRDQRVLLVLDNLEQIASAAKVVEAILMTAPRVVVLAASRRPLHLRGEQQWPVPTLELPLSSTLEAAERSSAVELFVQHARLGRPTFEITTGNVADVVAICRKLDGLPLAIELAASRVKLLGPRALLARLDQSMSRPAQDVDRPSRQQTLSSAIDWSYQLLTPAMRRRFRGFGVFVGGGDLDAIAAVVDPDFDALELVGELVDVSLLTITEGPDGEPRVALLETIGEFARAQLLDDGELEAVRRRHAAHYLDVAQAQAEELWRGLHQLAAKDRLAVDYDNIVAALGWALAAPSADDDLALRLAGSMWQFWLMTDRISEGRSWLERALAVSDGRNPGAHARALSGAGTLAWRQGDFETATDRHAAALRLQEQLGDSTGAAFSTNNLAVQAMDQGNDAESERLYVAARQLSGDRRVTTYILLNHGELARKLGDYERAGQLQEEALHLCAELGEEWLFGYLAHNLGLIAIQLDRPQQAATWFEHGLALVRRMRNSTFAATYLDGVAALCLKSGRPADAARLFGAALSLHELSDAGLDVSDSGAREEALAAARAALGEDGFNRLLTEGRQLSLDEALLIVQGILRPSPSSAAATGGHPSPPR